MMDCTKNSTIDISIAAGSKTDASTGIVAEEATLPAQNKGREDSNDMQGSSDNDYELRQSQPQQQQQQQQQARIQPMIEYYYENQGYQNQQNCFMFSALSYPFVPNLGPVAPPPTGLQKQENNCLNYQLFNNFQGYRWLLPRESPQYGMGIQSIPPTYKECHMKYDLEDRVGVTDPNSAANSSSSGAYWCKGDSSPVSKRRQSVKSARQKFSNKMHPVQLLHQIFRKEAFVMEYERVNDGPFSQVKVTYKVNSKSFTAEATRLKEARRLCAKQVLRDQFPDLEIELDNDIPEPEYDASEFDNKHPVQILYQIFRYEPMEMHCEEEGAAHFAKHIFTFSIRGKKYQAKAETIKEAKRRAAILALNDYFKEKRKIRN